MHRNRNNSGARSRTHGSSLRELGAPLDQERAASMADEGGVAGAHTDAEAQDAIALPRQVAETISIDWRGVAPWAALVVGLAGGVAAAAWAWQRRNESMWTLPRSSSTWALPQRTRLRDYWG